jgi:hypothetical protein
MMLSDRILLLLLHPPSSCCSHLKHSPSMKRFVSLQFLNLRQLVGLLARGISPLQGHYLTQNKHRQTSMPWVGFKPITPVFEQAKTFCALYQAATLIVIGWLVNNVDLERMQTETNLRYFPGTCLKGLKKTMSNVI